LLRDLEQDNKMEETMKLKNLLAIGISLFAFSAVSADDCNRCDPCPSLCDACDPCDGWSAHVDWLFWKVRRSGLDYAVDGDTNTSTIFSGYPYGKIRCLEPTRDSGVRVGVFKACDDFDFGVRYTYFSADDSAGITGFNIFGTRGHPIEAVISFDDLDLAASKYDVELNQFDIEAGYLFRTDCDGLVRPFAGARFASIDQSINTVYDELTGSTLATGQATLINEKLDMDAFGLYAGLEGTMDGWCNIGLFGRFSAGLALGEFNAEHSEYDVSAAHEGHVTGERVLHAKSDCYQIVPNWEFTVGLTYDLCDFCCVDWNLAIGYEFHEWCCLPDFINFDDDEQIGHLARNGSSLGFDGLFVRLGASF